MRGRMARTAERTAAAGLIGYMAPWVMWLFMLPLAAITWGIACGGLAYAVAMGTVLAGAGAWLIWHTWASFAPRKNPHESAVAVGTTVTAVLWVEVATMFGLFHVPDVSVWPEFWMAPVWVVRSFTAPIWAVWVVSGLVVSISWNVVRVGKRIEKTEGEEKKERGTSQLDDILGGAKLVNVKEIPGSTAGAITAELVGTPGVHTQDELLAKIERLTGHYRLRPTGIQGKADLKDASKVNLTILPIDPHEAAMMWPGPSAPGTSIADSPIPIGPYPDGEIAADWLCGSEKDHRPGMHKKISGVNGSGKTAGWRMVIADALTRTDVEFYAADVSGKVWQTFGPLLKYAVEIAGLNGVTDAGRKKNLRDVEKLIKWVASDAMARQDKWGKAGINQWGPECVERWGDKLRVLVIEEGAEILLNDDGTFTRVCERVRSAGWIIMVVVQQMKATNVPTEIRSQLPGAYCFGQDSSRDADMVLPEDVSDMLVRTKGADRPANWGNAIAGKCLPIYAGQPKEYRGLPIRMFFATNEAVIEALEKYGRPVRTDADIERLKGCEVASRPEPIEDEDEEDEVRYDREKYADEELDAIDADPAAPLRMTHPEDAKLAFMPPAEDEPDAPLPTEQMREIVQRHLTTAMANGKATIGVPEIAAMRPGTGHSPQNIRNELIRLTRADREPWAIGLVHPTAPGGSGKAGVYTMIAPSELRPGLSDAA